MSAEPATSLHTGTVKYGFLLTESQQHALGDLPNHFKGTVFVDSFANYGDTGPLFVMQPDGREVVVHEDGQIIDGEGDELRPGAVA